MMQQPFPIDMVNFFTRFADVMNEMLSAEILYGTDLTKFLRELSALYWKWAKNLIEYKFVN